jgi:hypothetical protein
MARGLELGYMHWSQPHMMDIIHWSQPHIGNDRETDWTLWVWQYWQTITSLATCLTSKNYTWIQFFLRFSLHKQNLMTLHVRIAPCLQYRRRKINRNKVKYWICANVPWLEVKYHFSLEDNWLVQYCWNQYKYENLHIRDKFFSISKRHKSNLTKPANSGYFFSLQRNLS